MPEVLLQGVRVVADSVGVNGKVILRKINGSRIFGGSGEIGAGKNRNREGRE